MGDGSLNSAREAPRSRHAFFLLLVATLAATTAALGMGCTAQRLTPAATTEAAAATQPASAPVGGPANTADTAASADVAAADPAPRTKPITKTLIVTHRQPAAAPDVGVLRVELLAVKDSRCPVEVQCVWAGLAVATLRVTVQAGTSTVAATMALGTPAPPALAGPREAGVGGFRFELAGLTPAASQRKPPALEDYVATVRYTAGPASAPASK